MSRESLITDAAMSETQPDPSSRPRAAWLSLLLLVSVALVKTILTKTIFDGLPTPVAYSLLSASVTWLLLLPPLCYTGSLRCLRWDDAWRVALVSVAVAIDLGMSNIAISLLPLALQQAIASAIPAATILLESLVLRRLKSVGSYAAIAMLCIGAVLMHLGSAPRRFQPDFGMGELAMGTAICAAAIKYVFAKAALSTWKAQYGSLGVLFWIEAMIAMQLLPWAILNGELAEAAVIIREREPSAVLLLCAAAALGGFRFFCELLVLRYWSATSLSAANLIAHALIVVVSAPCAPPAPPTSPAQHMHARTRLNLSVSNFVVKWQALGRATARRRSV